MLQQQTQVTTLSHWRVRLCDKADSTIELLCNTPFPPISLAFQGLHSHPSCTLQQNQQYWYNSGASTEPTLTTSLNPSFSRQPTISVYPHRYQDNTYAVHTGSGGNLMVTQWLYARTVQKLTSLDLMVASDRLGCNVIAKCVCLNIN